MTNQSDPSTSAATSSATNTDNITCKGCQKKFRSKNQLFRHLSQTAKTCLSPEEYIEYVTHVVSAKRNWEKIAVLFGYLPGTDHWLGGNNGISSGNTADSSSCGVEGGQHASWLVLQAVERVSRGITGPGPNIIGKSQNANSKYSYPWSPEEASRTKINRSYGNVSRKMDSVKQDPHTGAITEVLCTQAMPLHVNDDDDNDKGIPVEKERNGNDGQHLDSESNEKMESKVEKERKQKVAQWVESVNKELEQMISEMTRHRHLNDSDQNTKLTQWSPGKIRVFGRIPISNKKFNAEVDVVHRRVDYCFPADLLYSSKDDGEDEFGSDISATAVQSGAATLQKYLDSLPSFRPGNKSYRIVRPSDGASTSNMNLGSDETTEENENRCESSIYNHYSASHTSTSNANNIEMNAKDKHNLRPSFPRPNDETLTYLYQLKKVMQKFTTQVQELNVQDEAAVMEKEFHDKKRKRQREPKNRKKDSGKQESKVKSKDETVGKDEENNIIKENEKSLDYSNRLKPKDGRNTNYSSGLIETTISNENEAQAVLVKRVLRRKRFHNFCPNILAHDFLAYRRMDRIYHRGTIRLQELFDEKAKIEENESTGIKNRPFLIFSLTGDVFLYEQAIRVIGLLIAICRGVIDVDILDCMFDEEYTHLVPAPKAPRFGLMSGEATYMTWEGRLKTILSPRRCNRYRRGWNDEELVKNVENWEETVLKEVSKGWYWHGVAEDGRLNAEKNWLKDVLHPWARKTKESLEDYRRWKTGKEKVEETAISEGLTSSVSLFPPLKSIDTTVPKVFEKVLYYLRKADSSGLWPSTTPKRQLVMLSTSSNESQVKSLAVAHVAAKKNTETRSSAYEFKEGEGGASGSFSVGAMPGEQCCQPKCNLLFPELVKAAFELEVALRPDREPSSTIAINRNAQFRPHTDNGAGAGQSNSLIVGMGNYVGGELVVEGAKKDIRYKATEFDGWKERHWTQPFQGERYSLVWFTPKGCEGIRGIEMDFGSK